MEVTSKMDGRTRRKVRGLTIWSVNRKDSLTWESRDLRDSLIRDRIVGISFFKRIVKRSDNANRSCCCTFEAAELQKYKFNTPTFADTERLLQIHPFN